MSHEPGGRRWTFGPFVADEAARRLWRHAEPVALTPKAFALLRLLLTRPATLVSKAELFDQVWAGSVVTDSALSRVVRELRVALDDDAAQPRYVETAHGLGLRFVATVRDGILAPPHEPPRPVQRRTAPPATQLVGRQEESARLDDALARAGQGRRQVVLVAGEAGIGKTSLVQAFVERHSQRAEVVAAQGRCIEQYGSREAFLPLLEALERLAGPLGAEVLRGVLSRFAPSWLAMLPWLAWQGALVPAEPSAPRLLRELASALEALAAERTVILWLEDLHWSDLSTLDALDFLCGRTEAARLLVVASLRPADAPVAESPLRTVVQRLVQRGQAQLLNLGLLGPRTIEQYLAGRLGPGDPDAAAAMAALLHRRTEGQPLFMEALVADLLDRGELAAGADGWRAQVNLDSMAAAVPETLRELVQVQLAQMSSDERRLIGAAAVAGTVFCAAAVSAALGAELVDVEEACAGLVEAGRFLRAAPAVRWPDGTVSAGFAFVHALVWQALLEQVPPGRQAERQRRIAQRVEAAHGDHGGAVSSELAMRFEAGGDFASALRHLGRAGTVTLARCAYQPAVDQLRHGLDLLGRLPPQDRPRAELALRLPLGAAQIAAQGYASAEVAANYQRALELCRNWGLPGELERALRGLWNVALVRGDLAQAERLAAELHGLARAGGKPAALFDALAKQGQTALHQGRVIHARDHLEQALALPLRLDDPLPQRERPRVLAYLAWALWYAGESGAALARADAALAAAEAAGAHSSAFALGFVSWVHWFCGQAAEAARLAQRQRALSIEHGLRYWRAWSDFTCALSAADQPDATALDEMARAIDDFGAQSAEVGLPHFLDLYAQACLDAGQVSRARAALERSLATALRNGNLYQTPETLRLRGLADGDAARVRDALAMAQRQGSAALVARAQASLRALSGPDPGLARPDL